MKRILVIALLAGVLISTIGVTMAVGQGNPTITRAIFGSDVNCNRIWSAVGIVIFDTETGAWTLRTYGPLPDTDANLYYLGLSSSAPFPCPPRGRCADPTGVVGISSGIEAVDGRIDAEGLYGGSLVDVELFLHDRAVFLLCTNSI